MGTADELDPVADVSGSTALIRAWSAVSDAQKSRAKTCARQPSDGLRLAPLPYQRVGWHRALSAADGREVGQVLRCRLARQPEAARHLVGLHVAGHTPEKIRLQVHERGWVVS